MLSGGIGWYTGTKPIAFDGFAGTADSDFGVSVISARGHASYVFGSPALYAKPMVDVAATFVKLGDVDESGLGPASLIVDGGTTTVLSLSPAVEVGTERLRDNGTLVRHYARVGFDLYSNTDLSVTSSFAGAPDFIPSFTTSAGLDNVMAPLSLGVDVITVNNTNIRIQYEGQFGENTQVHSLAGKLSRPI